MPVNSNRVERVFFALRTNFFGDPDEHITLAYFRSVPWKYLMHRADVYRQLLPAQVRLNGFANWVSPGDNLHYEVALVNRFDNPVLYSEVTTPHITLNRSMKPIGNATFNPALFGQPDIIETLHLGKKIRGEFVWIPVENEPIMDTAKRSWELYGALT